MARERDTRGSTGSFAPFDRRESMSKSTAGGLAAGCVHCGLCTRKCDFLTKYGLDLQEFAGREELAYHCFLCGDCGEACPKGIDGRAIALSLRQERVERAGGKVPEKGYGALVAEKKDYLFRNYKRGAGKTVLFPGCNFPSFYPRTTDRIIALLKEKADIGVVFDCCGKPVSELGLVEADAQGTQALNRRLEELGVEELVVLCPNCYYFLKPRLTDVAVVSIYDKLRELGLGKPIRVERAHVFVPCPDKATHELEQSFLPFLEGAWENIPGVQCCGLGGCAAGKEPELAQGFREKVKERELPNVYAYCASCAGCLRRGGVENVRHILVDLLETGEASVLGAQSVWHRAKRRF